MKKTLAGLLVLLVGAAPLCRGVSLSVNDEQREALAVGVCRGTVLSTRCFLEAETGHVFTETLLRVDEAAKGPLPEVVRMLHRGGVADGAGEWRCGMPRFTAGETCLVYLERRADGAWCVLDGAHGVVRIAPAEASESKRSPTPVATALTVPGLLPGSTGDSFRFIAPGRGEPIGYLVDADALPTGVTQAQALNVVSNAFAAWQTASSAIFVFEGVQSFGKAASDFTNGDGKIRIQLHDLYDDVSGATTLGHGGARFSGTSLFPSGGLGGGVGAYEFDISVNGYVVLEHTKAALRNLKTLEEVLCHEIGHVLALAHTSEDPSEPNATLREAVMYFLAHEDGRGAAPTALDITNIRRTHPASDTPPYTYERVMDIVTASPPQWSVPRINEIDIRPFDRAGGGPYSVTLHAASSASGTFSVNGTTLKFEPSDVWTGSRKDPAGGSNYGSCYVRVSDGVNRSAPEEVRVISLNPDHNRDGLPDDWASANSVSGGGTDDDDGDGIANYWEWRLDSGPRDPSDVLKIATFDGRQLTFPSRGYELYQVLSGTDLTTSLAPLGNPLRAPGTSTSVTLPDIAGTRFFRVELVP